MKALRDSVGGNETASSTSVCSSTMTCSGQGGVEAQDSCGMETQGSCGMRSSEVREVAAAVSLAQGCVGRFLVEDRGGLVAGLWSRVGSVARGLGRWMNVELSSYLSADNSLALSVNGKRCGECQCVNMNYGPMNIVAMARQGGGL